MIGRRKVSTVSELSQAVVLSTDERFLQHPERGAAWRALAAKAYMDRTWGDCYGYLLVATGRAEVMVDEILSPWDAAALQPIIEEAGGVFTDWTGQRTSFGGNAIATNGALDAQVRGLLAREEGVMLDLSKLDFTKGNGLVTVVTQDARSGDVLMVAHADREALERTLATGEMHYRSRTRGLWHKGATSGNVQRVVSLTADCDGDAVLARVEKAGPACHTGEETCFGPGRLDALVALDATIAQRAAQAPVPGEKPSYTRRLLDDRNLRLKKIGEEGAELVTACADGDKARAVEEAADVLYHLLVAVRPLGLTLDDVKQVLAQRAAKRNP